MPIVINLTESDKGRWVLFEGNAGEREKGRIKSWNDKYIFVVYACDNDWNNYENFTAQATDAEKLTFIAESEVDHVNHGTTTPNEAEISGQ